MDGRRRTRGFSAPIAVLAEQQHGVVARRQLLEIGLSDDAIRSRLRQGTLHQLHRGVYAVGHRVLSRRGHWMAAVLFCGPQAVLSHRSAAALWGIRDYSGGYIDVTSPSRTSSRGAIRRHRALLRPDEVTDHQLIPVTTPPRTTFDLAATTSDAHLVETALRQGEYLRLTDPLSLPALVERHPGHRGIRVCRAALARLDEGSGHTREALEARFHAFLDTHRLLRPNFNAWLEVNGRRYQVDCLWPFVPCSDSHRTTVRDTVHA